MKFEIELQAVEKDIIPFSFPGFMSEGKCFLRIKVIDGKVILLCVQLPGYSGTSVTNAIEQVFYSAIEEMINTKIIRTKDTVGLLEKILSKKETIKKKKNSAIISYIHENSILIEHYPPGVGILNNGSFANVVFSPSGEPAWNYTTKEALETLINDKEVLAIDYEGLKNWK